MAQDPRAAWNERYFEWLRYVTEVAKIYESGRVLPVGPSQIPLVPPTRAPSGAAPARVIICSPHPDDESLVGALALCLELESGARVANCAITLGSDLSQRPRRLREVESACRALGFDLIVPMQRSGFDKVTLENRQNHPEEWTAKVKALAEIFDREKPDAVFAPHAEDFNTAHIGTHFLVAEALAAHVEGGRRGAVPLIETEFWHQLSAPNLMVGVTSELAAMMLMATAEHGGEVSRNPYHLRHPARLMDNVRRGSEVVGGQGAAAQDFLFAELYRVTFVRGSQILQPQVRGRIVPPASKINVAWIIEQFLPGAV